MADFNQSTGDFVRNRYYPSARTILLVRFDPGTRDKYSPSDVRQEDAPDPYLVNRRRTEFARRTGGLETGPQVFTSDVRQALTAANINLADAIARTPSRDGLSRYIDVQPLRSARRVNSYRIPDELDLTLSWKAIPFDSRAIRAILVFHYEGTVTADSYATLQRELSPASPLPSGYIVPATGANLRFVGQVDDISDLHDGEGDTVQLKARDLTSLLIDTKIPKLVPASQQGSKVQTGAKVIRPGTTIQEVIAALLATNDEFQIIRGPYLCTNGPLPTLDPKRYPRLAVPPKERHRVKGGGQPYILRNSANPGEETYWDAITDLCVSHGLVPTIERDQLILMEPRTLYTDTPTLLDSPGTPAFPRPGGHREQIGDTAYRVRRMVYGVNINGLTFKRKLGRIKAPAVRVTSYNPDARVAKDRLLSATHPPNADLRRLSAAGQIPTSKTTQATKVSATGQKASIEVHNVVVQGVIDQAQLARIAEQIYEAMGRQELGVTITTDELASYSDHPLFDRNKEPDLLDLKAGDPVQILVTPTDRKSGDVFSLAELGLLVQKARRLAQGTGARPEYTDAVAYLVAQGWKKADAKQLVKVLGAANLPQEFRVNTVSVVFDAEGGGYALTIDLRDYMRVRADPADVSATGGQRTGTEGSVGSGADIVGGLVT